MREESLVQFLIGGTAVVGHVHVLLFINGFQLGMEETENRVGETLAFNHQPTFQLIVRDILLIDSHIVGCEGIGALCADHGHQFVVLVRDGVFGSLVRNRVDLVINSLALGGIGGVIIDLVQRLDLLQLFLLFRPVKRAKVAGPFEHEVLEVVG